MATLKAAITINYFQKQYYNTYNNIMNSLLFIKMEPNDLKISKKGLSYFGDNWHVV